MAIALNCPKCGGSIYLGSPDKDNWDYVYPEYRPSAPCPHPGGTLPDKVG